MEEKWHNWYSTALFRYASSATTHRVLISVGRRRRGLAQPACVYVSIYLSRVRVRVTTSESASYTTTHRVLISIGRRQRGLAQPPCVYVCVYLSIYRSSYVSMYLCLSMFVCMYVRTQETSCSSDSRCRRKLSRTTDIVFWERRDRRCCVAAWV